MQEYSAQPITSNALPPRSKRVPELIRVPADEVIEGVCTSAEVFRLDTHYVGGQTRLCYKETGDCPHCGHASERWFGLVQVYRRKLQHYVWVQLPADAVYSLFDQLGEDRVLLGAEIKIGRERPTKAAPVWVRLGAGQTAPARLPKAANPKDTILKVFGTRENPTRLRKRK